MKVVWVTKQIYDLLYVNIILNDKTTLPTKFKKLNYYFIVLIIVVFDNILISIKIYFPRL